MRHHIPETQCGPSPQDERGCFAIDAADGVASAEDMHMRAETLSAIRAYKSETDRLLAETYAALAGDKFDVRSAAASVQAVWLDGSAFKLG